ncbi:hypothetical protein IFM89_014858 [Coptis chinensis]|uniref:Uncharacterized protein n=1 Tax=Coptis chinensis TaxID=261450 RepID=A0A835ICJ5_9MAGN|nr:hypothetical protein IFM89_014858 [Coptis chinensis]
MLWVEKNVLVALPTLNSTRKLSCILFSRLSLSIKQGSPLDNYSVTIRHSFFSFQCFFSRPPTAFIFQLMSRHHSPAPNVVLKSEPVAISGQAIVPVDQDRQLLDISGSFSSLLASAGHFGNLLEGLDSSVAPSLRTFQFGDFTEHSNSSSIENPTLDLQSSNNHDTFLSIQGGDSSCWSGGNGWPDLAIHTPGSSFQ